MSKIPPKIPPSSLPSLDESPAPGATPKAPKETSESGFDSNSTSATQNNQPTPPATQGALPSPTNNSSSPPESTSAPIPPPSSDVLADQRALATELFEIGGKYISGEDILRTISLVEEMETIIISSLRRQLNPKKQKRGFLDKIFDPRTSKEVPSPNDKPRSVKVRSAEDHSPAVKERYLSTEEKDQLHFIASQLPDVLDSSASSPEQSLFRSELMQLLSNEQVPLYAIRALLPIQESGSLEPISAGSTTKPAPEFTPKASAMLKEKAKDLGLLDDE